MKYNFHFNMDHWIKVLNEREARGFYVRRNSSDNIIKNHPLVGKKVYCLDSEKPYYTVDYVVKQWHLGYYIVLMLVDDNGSHRTFWWENINCHDNVILEDIETNKKILQILN